MNDPGRGYLLDVNILISLAWPDHEAHAVSTRWFSSDLESPWYTCVLTQLGFVRVSSHPSFPFAGERPTVSASQDALQRLLDDPLHVFLDRLADIRSPEIATIMQQARSTKMLTDTYLLALCSLHNLTLVTLDQGLKNLRPQPLLLYAQPPLS